jgi:uroporphyrinogen III methyltransferase / synthase
MKKSNGHVYLVGAGPGDPGLISVKGKACIEKADVLVYDYLAASSLLAYAREGAECIYVGKKGGDHTLKQHEINDLLVEKGAAGLMVTRLKGGDPFIFGRGGEEVEALIEAGISFDVVPGVTSAVAASAYAGIPLTHRKYTSTVAFVTGHEDPEKARSRIDWHALATGIGTLVFFMGVKNLPNIVEQLTRHGMSTETMIALIRWGTTTRQETVTGTLGNIVEKVAAAGLKSPAIIVVGDVVELRESMQWFENKPLMGKRMVVTRAREQASDLLQLLNDAGADCLECPTIQIAPPDDWEPLDRAIEHLSDYHWLVFTSVNGVKFFFKRLFEVGKDVRALHHIKTACIGPATEQRLRRFGLTCDILPESYRAESVVAAFKQQEIAGKKILLPRASEARFILPQELSKMGAVVDEIPVYVTRIADDNKDTLLDRLADQRIDCITFTSSSTVKNFKQLIPETSFKQLMAPVTVACIGPITADTARELGFDVHLVADTYTIPGLVDALIAYFEND